MQCNKNSSSIECESLIDLNFSNSEEPGMDQPALNNLDKALDKKLFKELVAAHLQLREIENKLPEDFFKKKKISQKQAFNDTEQEIRQGERGDSIHKKKLYYNVCQETKGIEKELHDSQQKLLDAIHIGLIHLHKNQNQMIQYPDVSENITAMNVQLMLSKMVPAKISFFNHRYYALLEEEIQWHPIPFSEMYLRVAQRHDNYLPENLMQASAKKCLEEYKRLRLHLDKIKDLERANLSHTTGKMFAFEKSFNKMKIVGFEISKAEAIEIVSKLTRLLLNEK